MGKKNHQTSIDEIGSSISSQDGVFLMRDL